MIMIPLVILAIESDDDRAYMTELYRQHHPLMLKTAWKYTRVLSEVEDIVSDSCVALIRHLDDVKKLSEGEKRAYIVTTTKNKAVDLFRKKQRDHARLHPMEESDLEQMAEPVSFERKISVREDLEQVKAAILALPEKERDTLRLKFFHHRSDRQIAEALGISEGAVRRHIMRGRNHLKAALYEGGGDE